MNAKYKIILSKIIDETNLQRFLLYVHVTYIIYVVMNKLTFINYSFPFILVVVLDSKFCFILNVLYF